MKKYSYYYNSQPISKAEFLAAVPENWEEDIDSNGEYSYGYYRAVERVENM